MYLNKVSPAVEIMSAGFCPHNCSYCYIPKSPLLESVHREIIEYIKDGSIFRRLKNAYGDSLEHIGLWGTEPTITLDYIGEQIPYMVELFPNLKSIDFSTSMITNPDFTCRFIDKLVPFGIDLNIQVSLDGPEWITDINREAGATEKVIENLFYIVEYLNKKSLSDTNITFRWKATHSIENIREQIENPRLITEYVDFFKGLEQRFKDTNKNRNVGMLYGSYSPTLVLPGKYTSEDGKDFARYINLCHRSGLCTTYCGRLSRLVTFSPVLYKRRQFTCSAADSNFGFSKFIHMCHRTYFLSYDNYIEAVLKNETSVKDVDNWDVTVFEKGHLGNIRRNFIVDPNNEFETIRFLYTMRGYHDYWAFDLNALLAMIVELAEADQLHPEYKKNKDLCVLLAGFVLSALSCPAENLMNTGNIHIPPFSSLRMFGNGAIQEILKEEAKKWDQR